MTITPTDTEITRLIRGDETVTGHAASSSLPMPDYPGPVAGGDR